MNKLKFLKKFNRNNKSLHNKNLSKGETLLGYLKVRRVLATYATHCVDYFNTTKQRYSVKYSNPPVVLHK